MTLHPWLRQERDFYRRLLSIALPIAGQSLISFSLTVMDTFFLGFVGENEIAAVTLATAPFFVVTLMIFGFQSGASVLFNQYWGKGDRAAMSRIVGIALYAGLALALTASLITFFLPYQVISFFTPDETLRALAVSYMRPAAFSYTINVFPQVYAAAMRAMGNAKVGLQMATVAMVLNVVLNAIFIFGLLGAPAMGVAGAAVGTLLSRAVELVLTLLHARFNRTFRLSLPLMLRPGRQLSRDFFHYAGPVVANEVLWGAGTSLYPAFFGHMTATIVAAYSIGTNIQKIFNVLTKGFGDACCVIIGTEIGAGHYRQVHSYSRTIIACIELASVAAGVLLLAVSPGLLSVFHIDADTRTVAQVLLVILTLRLPAEAFNYAAIIGLMRAGGDTRTAMTIDLATLWVVGVGGTFLTCALDAPAWLLFLPLLLDEMVKALLSFWRLQGGKWLVNITR